MNKYTLNTYIDFTNYIDKKRKNIVINNLQIIKENFYIIGKLNNCYFRTIGVEKKDKIYLLNQCKEKINDINAHLKYYSFSNILKILNITKDEYEIYMNFRLKESKEYKLGKNL